MSKPPRETGLELSGPAFFGKQFQLGLGPAVFGQMFHTRHFLSHPTKRRHARNDVSSTVILYVLVGIVTAHSAFGDRRAAQDKAVENAAAKAFSLSLYRQTGRTMKRINPPAYVEQFCNLGALERSYPTLLAFQIIAYAHSQDLQTAMSDVVQMWSEFGDNTHPPLRLFKATFPRMKRYAIVNCAPREENNRVVIAVFEREPVFDPPEWMREWGHVFWP